MRTSYPEKTKQICTAATMASYVNITIKWSLSKLFKVQVRMHCNLGDYENIYPVKKSPPHTPNGMKLILNCYSCDSVRKMFNSSHNKVSKSWSLNKYEALYKVFIWMLLMGVNVCSDTNKKKKKGKSTLKK